MRHVLLAFAALALAVAWANTSREGKRLKRQMLQHPEQPARLY